jgi:DNA-directed RNA polymerase specialized sigma24 family protein
MRAPLSDSCDDVFDAIANPSVVGRLCENDRHVLVARYVERRTTDEIAATLRVLPRVVQQRLARALRSMRRALSDELFELAREGLRS